MYKDKTSGLSCSGDRSQVIEWAEWIIREDPLLELLTWILSWLLQPIYVQEEGRSPCYLHSPGASTDHALFQFRSPESHICPQNSA